MRVCMRMRMQKLRTLMRMTTRTLCPRQTDGMLSPNLTNPATGIITEGPFGPCSTSFFAAVLHGNLDGTLQPDTSWSVLSVHVLQWLPIVAKTIF